MKYVLLLLILGTYCKASAQHNDGQAATYNILSGAVIDGVGAVINKTREQKVLKVLAKGAYQGALGGYITFESKRLVRNFSRTDDYGYVWPSKILNSAGNSIVRNAASNRDFWERWYINIGFNHLEYDIKRDKRFRYRILPFALVGVSEGFIKGTLDFERTVKTGNFIFEAKEENPDFTGQTFVNSIKYNPDFIEVIPSAFAHELIHSYQYEGTFGFNSYLEKTSSELRKNSEFYRTYDSIFLTDYNYLVVVGVIGIQTLQGVPVSEMIDEKEAYYYQEFDPEN